MAWRIGMRRRQPDVQRKHSALHPKTDQREPEQRREPGLLAELYAHLVAPDLPEALYDWAAVVLTDRAPILIDVDPTEGLRSVRHTGQIEALTLALASSETANTAAPDEYGFPMHLRSSLLMTGIDIPIVLVSSAFTRS